MESIRKSRQIIPDIPTALLILLKIEKKRNMEILISGKHWVAVLEIH